MFKPELNKDVNGSHKQATVEGQAGSEYSRVSIRCLVISFLFLIFLTILSQNAGLRGLMADALVIETWIMPSEAGVFLVLVLLVLNYVFKRFTKISLFTPAELIVCYIIVMVGGYVQSIGIVGFSVMNIVQPWYNAILVNAKTYAPGLEKLSPLVAIKDMDAGLEFWAGTDTGVPWDKWVGPIIAWTVFWSVLFFLMISIGTILRKHWSDHERLTYPLTVPITAVIKQTTEVSSTEMNTDVPLWRNKLLYIGMIYPFILGVPAILSRHIPSFPKLSGYIPIAQYFTEKPWSALQLWPPVDFSYNYPAVVGISYLLRLDLLFSLWFFYLFAYRGLLILFTALGYESYYPLLPTEISRGVYIGVAIMAFWFARYHIKDVFVKAFKGDSAISDHEEPLSYRTAVFGGFAALVFVFLFAKYLLAMSAHIIIVFMIIFLATVIGYGRLRAEAGYPHGQAAPLGTYVNLMHGIGKDRMTVNDAMGMALSLQPMQEGFAAVGMVMGLETFRFATDFNIKPRTMTKIIMAAVIVALLVGYTSAVPVVYKYGANNLDSYYSYAKGAVWFHVQEPARHAEYFASLGVGIVVAIVLSILRATFVWWPFYPVALGIATADWMRLYWGSFFIAWVVKSLVLRYGGPASERKLKPVFYGMIFGQVMVSLLGTISLVILQVF